MTRRKFYFHWLVQQRSQGFTLAEVLASILVISLFTLAAMQAIVVAAFFQADARKFAEASHWIQDDLENIKIVAYDLCQTKFAQRKLAAPAQGNDTTLTLALIQSGESDYDQAMPPEYRTGGACPVTSPTDGFRVGDRVLIGSDSGTRRIVSMSANTITLDSPVGGYRGAGTRVYARCRIQANETNGIDGGFGAYLQTLIPPMNSSNNSRPIVNDTFTMTRTPTTRAEAPFQTLELAYSVRNSNNRVVAQLSTEVVPNAFFRCP
ncbi:prepilin-type N-terminal cleavage/methylation domain-containing protein [Thermosynechococcus sp. QS41]|uniref:type IV pilus modification PilV family protein n=1 Tax=unclassified Thermosynechococcus TaxID=2622553 RepID=UPI001981D22A|nr:MULTISPECIES: prepilin-type N-terminal cleavage/methylation domain-containing protein [unclassified Thermosynechococcus]QSF48835.1 prepilin-type N-terminal cleavage/methylation domain-containing protein [Thermosynechococcus sp. TA-1]WNC21887.1 prepilin-type N-terminal cleavage/methylation domain-containing protein [Thermosynechococcus sp. PP22]WNC52352.1 prepilin-type N-terminal cleavage/methylation domain-containing protein [Thermosynechococcus sp. TG215]WNC57438.1 prepilin-type N-terminal 